MSSGSKHSQASSGAPRASAPNGSSEDESPEDSESVAEAVTDALTEKVIENPYGTLAAAFAVGYVAGGGLFTKTTARMIQMGVRLAAIPQVRKPLLDLAEDTIDRVLELTSTKKA
jgi:hypothetical protein